MGFGQSVEHILDGKLELSVPFEAMNSASNQNRVSLSASIGERSTLPSPIGWERGWG